MKRFEAPILAIETSCDETSAAIISGTEIRSNVVSSQADLHKKWGGVVPEVAARAHVETILPVIDEALEQAGFSFNQLGAVAVTNRPGLVGALSVGVTAAKGFAFTLNIPLIGIHHLEGHLLSVLALDEVVFPHLALIVSGGHTELVAVEAPGSYRVIGGTRDDAAGEAFDKGARLLGLGYPGGKAIEDLAKSGDAKRYPLPIGETGEPTTFSFSGLKTAMLRLVEREGDALDRPSAAASLQHAIVEALVIRSLNALEALRWNALSLVGGVAANAALRQRLKDECERRGATFLCPPFELCTDNAAMIGLAAGFRLARGERDGWAMDAQANAPLP